MPYHTTGSQGNNMYAPGVHGYHNPALSYPDGESIPEALPDSYQLGNRTDHIDQQCDGCYFFQNNMCYKWVAPVRSNYWCASYYKQEIYTSEPQIPDPPASYPVVETMPTSAPPNWVPPDAWLGEIADPIFSEHGNWVYKLNTDINPDTYEWVPAGPNSQGGFANTFVALNIPEEELTATDLGGNVFEWMDIDGITLESGEPDLSTLHWQLDRTENAAWRDTLEHPFHYAGEWILRGRDVDGDGVIDEEPSAPSIYPAPGSPTFIRDKKQIREAVHDKIVRLFAKQNITREQLLQSQKTVKNGKIVQSRSENDRLVLFQKDANLYTSDVGENYLIGKLVNYLFLQYYRTGATDVNNLTTAFSMQVNNLDGLGKQYILHTGLSSNAPITSFVVGEEGGPNTEPGTILNALNIGQLIETDNDFTYDKEKAAEVLDIQIDELLPRGSRRQELVDDFFRLYAELRPPEYPNFQDTNNDGLTDYISQQDFVNFGVEYNISNKDGIENFETGNKFLTWLRDHEDSNNLNKSLQYLYEDLQGFFKQQELDLTEEMEDGRPEYEDVSSGYLKLRALNQGMIIRKQEGTDIGFIGQDLDNPIWQTSGFGITQWVRFLNKEQDGTLLNFGNPFGKEQPQGFVLETFIIHQDDILTIPNDTNSVPLNQFWEKVNAVDGEGVGAFEPGNSITYGQLTELLGMDTFAEYDRARFLRLAVRHGVSYYDNSIPVLTTTTDGEGNGICIPRFDITTTAGPVSDISLRRAPQKQNENSLFLLTYTQLPIDFDEWYFICASYDPINVEQTNYASIYNSDRGKQKNFWLNHIAHSENQDTFVDQSGMGNTCNVEFISKSRLLRARGFQTDEPLTP